MSWPRTSPVLRTSSLVFLGILLASACADEDLAGVSPSPTEATSVAAPAAASVSATPPPVAVRYVCDGGKTFDAYVFPTPAQRAIVVVDGRTLDLPQTRSASGIRYSDGTLVYHSKGRDAFIEIGGVMTYVNCVGDKP